MTLLVLFERGIEVRGIDQHHLMRRPMLADVKQVDERCDPTPPEPGHTLDRFLVVVASSDPNLKDPSGPSEINVDGHLRPERATPAPNSAYGVEIENSRVDGGL